MKRASAVRFADQVNKAEDEDLARLQASLTDEDIIRQSNNESLVSSNKSIGVKDQPVAKVKGRQLVGSVDIEDADEMMAAENQYEDEEEELKSAGDSERASYKDID